jgi:integrase
MMTLRQAAHEYLRIRRRLGFKLHDVGKALDEFIRFLEQRRAPVITQALALTWAQQPAHAQPAHWARRLSIVRAFAHYRRATDPRTEVPAPGLLPFQPHRARPYLYSAIEIRQLLRAARDMPCRYTRGRLRPWVYYTFFGLLSVTGLRVSEARSLELGDVDLDAAVLTVRGAKFGKTRLVPLHASTCDILRAYLRRRARHWRQRPVSSYVFVSSWGNRLDSGDIHRTFYALSRQVGYGGPPTVGGRASMTSGSMPGSGLSRVRVFPGRKCGGSRECDACGPGIITGSPRTGATGLPGDSATV